MVWLAACAGTPEMRSADGADVDRMRFDVSDRLFSDADVTSCARLRALYAREGWPEGNSIEVIEEIDARVRARFTYERERDEVWTNYAEEVLRGEEFRGDCDDLATTSATLALCAGVPPEQVGYLLTRTITLGGDPRANHMLAFYRDPTGRPVVFGDTFGPARSLAELGQRPRAWTFLSHQGVWSTTSPVWKRARTRQRNETSGPSTADQ